MVTVAAAVVVTAGMAGAITSAAEKLQGKLHALPFRDVSLVQRMLAVGLSDWSVFGRRG